MEENTELPTGAPNSESTEPNPSGEASASVSETNPTPTSTFTVEGQNFATERDAFEYMRGKYTDVQTELKMAAARMEGMQEAMAQNTNATPQPAPVDNTADNWDDEAYWADPKGYVKVRMEKEREVLRNEFKQTLTQQQTEQQIWSEFTVRYPELSGFKDEVTGLSNQYANEVGLLARKDRNSAYDFVATKLKDRFKQYASALHPTKDLSNEGGGPSDGNSNVTKTPKEAAPKKPMDFAAQLRSIKK